MRNLLLALLLIPACDNSPLSGDKDLSAASGDMTASADLAGVPACDIIKQDCPKGQKCTIVETGTGQDVSDFTMCVAATGTGAVNDACTRTDIGIDTCGTGLFCTGLGWPGTPDAPMRHCNKLCTADTDCLTGQKCEGLTDDGLSGLCAVTCEIFSTTCAAGLTCTEGLEDIDTTDQNNPDLFTTCRQIGTGALTDSCMDDTDCGVNMFCDDTGSCNQFCDDDTNNLCPNEGHDGGFACAPFDPSGGLGSCN